MAHEYGKETLSKEFKSDRDKGLPDSELVEAVVALANTGACIWVLRTTAPRPVSSASIKILSGCQR